MEGPPLGPGGEDITWPDQVPPRGRKVSSTRKIKPQTSNLLWLVGSYSTFGAIHDLPRCTACCFLPHPRVHPLDEQQAASMTASHNPGHATKGNIKSCESRLGASISPRFPTLDGRPRRPISPFLQLWFQFGLSPRRVAWRSLRAKIMGVSVNLLVDRVWNGRSDLQAGVEIYHWGYPGFWLILSSENDPLSGPQFHPPVWSIGGPISLCPWEVRT